MGRRRTARDDGALGSVTGDDGRVVRIYDPLVAGMLERGTIIGLAYRATFQRLRALEGHWWTRIGRMLHVLQPTGRPSEPERLALQIEAAMAAESNGGERATGGALSATAGGTGSTTPAAATTPEAP